MMNEGKAIGAEAQILFDDEEHVEQVYISFLPEPSEIEHDDEDDLRTFFYGSEDDEEEFRNGSEGWKLLDWILVYGN